MSAIAVHAMANPGTAPASANAPSGAAADADFSSLLGEMTHAKPSPPEAAPKAKSAADEASPSAQSALQSLEAALTGLGAPAVAAPPPKAAARNEAASPLRAALAAAAAALDKGGSSAPAGQAPLKTLLQADPSLGLSDFQIKTFLAAAGATPTRAGATTLSSGAAWTPLAAAEKPEAEPLAEADAAPAGNEGSAGVATLSAFAFSRSGEVTLSPRAHVSPAPPANDSKPSGSAARAGGSRDSRPETPAARSADAVAAAASAKDAATGGARRDENAVAPPVAAAGAAAAEAASTPSVTVAFANLPAFIADQASALASESTPEAAAAAPTSPAKAAQAVKELQIALDPADLGQMTLKLRLAGGKLSVTIGVANPQTLAAIEDDRALIAARLGAGDSGLEDLLIQRQVAGAPPTETGQTHGFANDSDSQSSSSRNEAEPQERNGRAPRAAPQRGGRGDGDFVV